MTESLTTHLARTLASGAVVSRSSAMAYRGRVVSARLIGQELGVRCVLEGSVSATRQRVRVNLQLIDAAADVHVRAERFAELIRRAPDLAQRPPARLVPAETDRVSPAYWAREARIVALFARIEAGA